ncbi:hypothetical protein GCM10029978_068560 [Actinoallomurus acanthiterrae]
MWTGDLKTEAVRLGNPCLPDQTGPVHHALHDARYNREIDRFLTQIATKQEGPRRQ